MKFNENLLNLRKQKGWSQEELGYKLDVSRQTVSKWEAGQTTPELEKLELLAEIFEISIDELVGKEPKNNENVKLNKKKILKRIIVIILILIFFVLLGFFTYRFYIIDTFLKKLDLLINSSNYSITEENRSIDRYMQKYDECVQTFYRDSKISKVYYNGNTNVSNIVRIEHIDFNIGNRYYYDINEENKTYKKIKIEELRDEIIAELTEYEFVQAEVDYKFQLGRRLKDKLKIVFNINKYQLRKYKIENQYDLQMGKDGNKYFWAICGDDYLRFYEATDDEQERRKSKSTIYTLRIGNIFEVDVELPDLSEYTLIEE